MVQLLDDVKQVENVALRSSTRVIGRLRQEVIRAYQSREPFSAAFVIQELGPLLTKATAISHVAGQRRAVLLARKGVKKDEVQLDLLDNVLKLLKKTIKVNIDKVVETYKAISLKALGDLTAPIEIKVRKEINNLIGEGATLKDAISKLDETLNNLGVGNVSENKLETTFRTQLQTSYNAGRWQADQDPDIQEILYGYKYVTVGDDRVRESHAELDGVTLPKDDPFWLEYWPPNGYNCRCQVIPIFEERESVHPGRLPDGSIPLPDEGFRYNPGVVLTDATSKADFQLAYSVSMSFAQHDYSTTQIPLPKELADEVQKLAAEIDDKDLHEKGRGKEPHVTVKYGLHTNDADEVKEVVKDSGSIRVRLGATSIFENEEFDVVKIAVNSDRLHKLNALIGNKLQTTDTHKEYKPHITLAYVKKGLGEKYAKNYALSGKAFVVDEIEFRNKNGQLKNCSLI